VIAAPSSLGRATVLVFFIACGSRTELDAPASKSGHAVSFESFGDDVWLAGVNATPASGFTWDFWFDASKLPTKTGVDIHAGATMMVASDDVGCEDVYVGFGTELSPANRLAFNVDGAGSCGARDTSPIDYAPPEGFSTNRWYFVAVSHDYATGESRLYLDGALVAKKTSSVEPIPRTLSLTLGRWWDRHGDQYQYNQFDGAIDELHVYSRALSDAEVSNEHACAAPASGLVAGYHFDEGLGNSAANFAGGTAATLEHDAKWVTGSGCAP
jgi:hypothetical protein